MVKFKSALEIAQCTLLTLLNVTRMLAVKVICFFFPVHQRAYWAPGTKGLEDFQYTEK